MALKACGVSRKCDELGRIVIPKEIVKSIGYNVNQSLDIRLEDSTVILSINDGGAGIVRCLDDLNRIVIPKAMRTTLNINDKTPIEFYISDEKDVFLKVFTDICAVCGEDKELTRVKNGKFMCQTCIDFISKNCD